MNRRIVCILVAVCVAVFASCDTTAGLPSWSSDGEYTSSVPSRGQETTTPVQTDSLNTVTSVAESVPSFVPSVPSADVSSEPPFSSNPTSTAASEPMPTPTLTPIPTTIPTPERTPTPTKTPSPTPTPTPTPPKTPSPTPTPTGKPDYSYLGLGAKFYDKFNLDGSVTYTDTTYTSGRLHVEITKHRYEDANIYVADVYLCDIEDYASVFAKDSFGSGATETVTSMAERSNAILAINADYYGAHSASFLVRNGEMYYDTEADDDICILYKDGRMETFFEDDFDYKDANVRNGAWQAFGFGPKLMDNGEVLYDPPGSEGFAFNSGVKSRNPRTAIGYYEPGHYCLVFVEGRSDESKGLEMNQLAAFMGKIGCTDAFNLDGGQTSMMVFMGNVVGQPYKGGRKCSDIIAITDCSA